MASRPQKQANKNAQKTHRYPIGNQPLYAHDVPDQKSGDFVRHNDISDDLAEGFEPSPVPPPNPDGSLQLPRLRVIPPPPPSLCEYGCGNYHEFSVQVDSTQPTDGGHVFHTQKHRYCYPSPGVETRLGDMPVTACNRFDAHAQSEQFWRDTARWRDLVEAEAREHAANEQAAADDLAAMPDNDDHQKGPTP